MLLNKNKGHKIQFKTLPSVYNLHGFFTNLLKHSYQNFQNIISNKFHSKIFALTYKIDKNYTCKCFKFTMLTVRDFRYKALQTLLF